MEYVIVMTWSGLVLVIIFKLLDLSIGLRATVEEERRGLDTSSHGESAYHFLNYGPVGAKDLVAAKLSDLFCGPYNCGLFLRELQRLTH